MKKIIVASTNPVKLNATLQAFQTMFPDEHFEIEGVAAASGVSDQPRSDGEACTGALNRASNARKASPQADFFVGIEGGIEDREEDMLAFAWVAVLSDRAMCGKARTSTFILPPKVAQLIREGKELGEADDIVFERTNSKQANGAVGLLTGDIVTRTSYYIEAVALALIPFKNKTFYT